MAKYDLHAIASVTRALADENRLRALLALQHGELCVCQIVELLQLAPSTVSKHMRILRTARLVEARKFGRWVYYRLPDESADLVQEVLNWLCGLSGCCAEFGEDRDHLEQILSIEPQTLYQLQIEGGSVAGTGTEHPASRSISRSKAR